MVYYLKNHFILNDSKEFNLIPQEKTAIERAKGREGHKIPGCSSAHIISFYPDGAVTKQNSPKYTLLDNRLATCDNVTYEDEVDCRNDVESDCRSDDKDDWSGCLDATYIVNCVEENSFVAIKAPPNSVELFYIMKIVKKGIADDMFDSTKEHFVLKGEPYLVGKWISYQRERKKVP